MEESLLQLSAGGIFCLLLLREVFAFINNWRSNKDSSCPLSIEKIASLERKILDNDRITRENHESLIVIHSKVNDLHNWHKVEDPETGIKVWYVNVLKISLRDLKASINALKQKIEGQNHD